MMSSSQSTKTLDDFFAVHRLPATESLSLSSKETLRVYLEAGNRKFRTRKLREFLHALDWFDIGSREIRPLQEQTLDKLAPRSRESVFNELLAYQQNKKSQKKEATERRRGYRLRVYEYYRETISSEDKALLESLRDYELNLTARDVNWRYYFTLDSFKKIDDFSNAPSDIRQRKIERFKADVAQYLKNHQKQTDPHQAEPSFSFDDWCDEHGEESFTNSGSQQQNQHHNTHQKKSSYSSRPKQPNTTPTLSAEVKQALNCMGVAPGTSWKEIKSSFRKLTLAHHPDVNGGDADTMKRIISAYERLKRVYN